MALTKTPRLIPIALNGDLQRGGYVLTGEVHGDTDAVAYPDNWRLMGKSGAEFVDAAWREIINCHLIGEPDDIEFGRYQSKAVVTAGTMDRLLDGESLQAIGFTDQSSPANDHQVNGLTLAHIVEHIIEAHCNVVYDATDMPDGVITTTTIDTTNSTPVNRYNVKQSDSIWKSIQSIGGGESGGEFYRAWFNRKNHFYYQPAPPFWQVVNTSKGTIDADHIRGQMSVKRVANEPGKRIGQVVLTAFEDDETEYVGEYPTDAGDGKIYRMNSGVIAQGQVRVDALTQRLYQWLTRLYMLQVEVDPGLILFGDDGDGLDLADKITVNYRGPAQDAISGAGVAIDLNFVDFFVYGVDIKFDANGKAAQGFLTLEYDPTQ